MISWVGTIHARSPRRFNFNYSIKIFVIIRTISVFQNIFSQCAGNGVGGGYNAGLGYGAAGLQPGVGAAGLSAGGLGYGAGGLGYGAGGLGYGASGLGYSGAGPYGGVGNGDVSVTGELPVAGMTIVGGQIPVLGAVQFSGSVPAAGTVTISGTCNCGYNGGVY